MDQECITFDPERVLKYGSRHMDRVRQTDEWTDRWASSREKQSSGFPTKPDSNQSPQLQRLSRKLKFHL